MNIWILNDYAVLPSQGGQNRHYYLAKYLTKLGHNVAVFVGSHPHNTNLQMIEGKERYKVNEEHGFPWVYVKTYNYGNSKVKRVFSMFKYCKSTKKAVKQFNKPDVIIGSSAHPLAARLAVKLGKKYKCQSIVEIRDLWPESIVAFGVCKQNNPLVRLLRKLEKWMYQKADKVLFTMEGAYDYIIEQKWEKDIPKEKVYYLNNGVDLEAFEYNVNSYKIDDIDLKNDNDFKIIYTGSIRQANNLGLLLDAAKLVKTKNIKFLIWGDGNQREILADRVKVEKIRNVVFKGRIEKKYIPYIVSSANLNYAHVEPSTIFRFGISANKIFDYLASGKPTLCDFPCTYNPVIDNYAGLSVGNPTAKNVAEAIDNFVNISKEEYNKMCKNALETAEKYSFESLTNKLVKILEE